MVALALVAGTFLAGAVSEAPLWLVLVCMLVCAPVAVMGRVVIDLANQPGSHDLWPLEIALAVVLSLPAVGIGALVALGVRRLSPRRPA
jgi:hypothetical protein